MTGSALTGQVEFHVNQSTQVIAGRGVIDQLQGFVATYGDRVLLVAGDAHLRASGVLAGIEGALTAAGLTVNCMEGVPANPSVTAVDAGAALARAWRADVVVAIGGGSVIDVAKAIAVAAAEHDSGTSFRTHLSGLRNDHLFVTRALPCVAVPTMLGSGSETNATSVITDDETGRKLSAHDALAAPRIAILDTDLLVDAPSELLGPGLADAWCHALEALLSVRSSVASDSCAEQSLRLLQRHAACAMEAAGPEDARHEALLACWWAANLAGHALSLAGSIVTHPLAHPLSARLDARHGVAVAALEPATLAVLAPRLHANGALARVAGVLDIKGVGNDVVLRGVLTRLSRFCALVGVRSGVSELGLSPEGFDLVVRDARLSASRGLGNVPGGEVTSEELYAILELACAVGPASTAKRVLDTRARQAERQRAAAASIT